MAYFLFPAEESAPADKKNPVAISAYKGEKFFAKHIPQDQKDLGSLVTVHIVKKGFMLTPKLDLVMSVTGLHKGNKGCCRILFLREDRKKSGERLSFVGEEASHLTPWVDASKGKILKISTGIKNALIYSDELLVGKSPFDTIGVFLKKSFLPFQSTSSV